MKISNKYILSLLAGFAGLVSFTSCSNDNSEPMPGKELDNVNLQFTLGVPASTRAASDPGDEARIKAANVYFCKVTDSDPLGASNVVYTLTNIQDIEYGEADANGIVSATLTMSVKAREFAAILAGNKLRMYVVANTSKGIINNMAEELLSFGSLSTDGLGNYGTDNLYLPMSNNKESGIMDFSGKSIQDILKALNKDNSYYNLSTDANAGQIVLERAVARIDYMDGSESQVDHVYPLGSTGLYIKINYMMPVNVATKEYLFPHTAAGNATAATGNTTLFGNGTWIADYDWNTKKTATGAAPAGTFFNQPSGSGDNTVLPSGWTTLYDKKNMKEYTPMFYISENTLPSTAKMIEGLSTGIVFETALCDVNGSDLNEAQLMAADAPWKNQVSISKEASGDLVLKYKGVSTVAKLHEQHFDINYYYWIRHNDVSNSLEITDQMEFGVVRNTIYKLKVTKFGGLPRPYDPSAPDEEKPLDPEEIIVEIAVIPWGYFPIDVTI